jgi:hypothetical protein
MRKDQLKLRVKILLEEHPETRNSDITLMIKMWQTYFQVGNEINLGALYILPTHDNIKRARAFIQNEEGLFLPTDEKVRRQRKIAEQDWLDWLQKEKASI